MMSANGTRELRLPRPNCRAASRINSRRDTGAYRSTEPPPLPERASPMRASSMSISSCSRPHVFENVGENRVLGPHMAFVPVHPWVPVTGARVHRRRHVRVAHFQNDRAVIHVENKIECDALGAD